MVAKYVLSILISCMIGLAGTAPVFGFQYHQNNDFRTEVFPGSVHTSSFSIPLAPQQVVVVYPASLHAELRRMQDLFFGRCECHIPFVSVESVRPQLLKSSNIILIGNISNNKWLLDLYKRRYAFADNYFPGEGGYAIHPAKSIWNRSKNTLVIEASDDRDLVSAFNAFIAALPTRVKSIGPMRDLKTRLAFPAVQTVKPLLERSRTNPHVDMPPYSAIADWGLAYHLTGDKRWAKDFLIGIRTCFQRAQATGQWVPEQWTNVYFNLWKMIYAWDLIDDDPVFTPADRKMIDQVLWGYARFCDWLPNLDIDQAPPDEPRQNHTTFLALSLFYAHRYFNEEYGITALNDMVPKYQRAFEHGAATSYRPNDDAAGYIELAPSHLLTYEMATGEDSFLASGQLKTLAKLLFLDLDNRNDPVSFGDVGGFQQRGPGAPRGSELNFFSMAAWYYKDPRFQAIYDWDKKVTGGAASPDLSFSLAELYMGTYAVAMKAGSPADFLGIRYVLMDDAALRWSAMRSEQAAYLPRDGQRYFDKLAFRPDLNPQNEYLLMDGLSTFAHGHYDGNTILRLTWKDRVWLMQSDYVKLTAKYQNGVVVTRNSIQEPPPPLNALDYAAEFPWGGVTKTVSHAYNGADWVRDVVWLKGKYFVVLDEVKANQAGHFRLEPRWRVVGDAHLKDSGIVSRQGNAQFTIDTADDTPRTVYHEGSSSKSDTQGSASSPLDVPVSVYYGRKDLSLSAGDHYTFGSLLYADSVSTPVNREFYKGKQGTYIISGGGEDAAVGTDMGELQPAGVDTDASFFVMDSDRLSLVNAKRARFGASEIQCATPFHLSISKGKGLLIVDEGAAANCRMRGIQVADIEGQPFNKFTSVQLKPGHYALEFSASTTNFSAQVKEFLRFGHESTIHAAATAPRKEFGVGELQKLPAATTITSFAEDGKNLLYGDAGGSIYQLYGDHNVKINRLPSLHAVTVLRAADLQGDGKREIIAADDDENLFVFASGGRLLWKRKLSGYRLKANATDITIADLGKNGKTILVATAAWSLSAFDPEGNIRWKTTTKYHEETKVQVLKRTNNEEYIGVGTEYQTPLNVLSTDGSLLWYTWEEMGSEFLAKTPYCGFGLTAMLTLDTDNGGKQEVIFGTKSNTIYALDLASGAFKWQANVGDEVTAMSTLQSAFGHEKSILVATAAGELFEFGRSSRILQHYDFGSGIIDIHVLPYKEHQRSDIVLTLQDGTVIVCDDAFRIRATFHSNGKPTLGTAIGQWSDVRTVLYEVSPDAIRTATYLPYFLRPSRNY